MAPYNNLPRLLRPHTPPPHPKHPHPPSNAHPYPRPSLRITSIALALLSLYILLLVSLALFTLWRINRRSRYGYEGNQQAMIAESRGDDGDRERWNSGFGWRQMGMPGRREGERRVVGSGSAIPNSHLSHEGIEDSDETALLPQAEGARPGVGGELGWGFGEPPRERSRDFVADDEDEDGDEYVASPSDKRKDAHQTLHAIAISRETDRTPISPPTSLYGNRREAVAVSRETDRAPPTSQWITQRDDGTGKGWNYWFSGSRFGMGNWFLREPRPRLDRDDGGGEGEGGEEGREEEYVRAEERVGVVRDRERDIRVPEGLRRAAERGEGVFA